jgi:hypothetical protein
MKVISNTRLINRNQKIGRYVTIASLIVLGGGIYISFMKPDMVSLYFGALILGFILSQIGIYFGTRWGRSPRPDEMITGALKGLDDKYTLYHYSSIVPHLLIGPAGIFGLIPFKQKGTITYDPIRNRWKQKGGNVFMRVFGQEGLGRPDIEVQDVLKTLDEHIAKNLPELPVPEPSAVLVFLTEGVDLQAERSAIPALKIDKLKDFLRRRAKESPAPMDIIQTFQKTLPTYDD